MNAAALALYVRDGCHLCDEFLLDFSLDHPGLLGILATHDVDAEAALANEVRAARAGAHGRWSSGLRRPLRS
ncbi:MAG: hypothetical protein IPF50_02375 [Proteobacteria bacterium]|nr:hypothetical protein [Pseudomonadota bacterium]